MLSRARQELVHLAERFVPPKLATDGDEKRRALLAIAFSGLIVAWCLVLIATLVVLAGLSWWPLLLAVLVTALLAAAQPLLLRATRSLVLVGNSIALVLWLPLLFAAIRGGGLPMPGQPLLALLPMIALLLAGRLSAAFWSIVAVLQILVVSRLRAMGYEFPVTVPPELAVSAQTLGTLFLVGTVVTLSLAYEHLRARALTELRTALDELATARDAAVTASRLKSEFVATISHEIRTPMNGVVGMTGLLLETPLSAEQREYVESIRSSGESLTAIVNDILDFSKIESGRLELEKQPFDPRDCVAETLELLRPQAAAKRLALRSSCGAGVPAAVLGDVTRLRQVLVNLVGNAVKFTERGSVEVTLEWASREGGPAELRFAVRDTGIGIPAERLERLFQPFTQGDASMSRRYGGTGLGLVISKRLAEAMGGRMWVESEPGAGSCFHFTVEAVPAVLPPRAPSARVPTHDLASSHPLRILLAEDNHVNQRVAVRMLERLGYRAEVAASGREVLQALERQPFDLVLMDVQMPEMDGLETTRRIRARWGDAGPRIVAMTANAMQGDRDRCLAAGMDDYITKPLRRADLAAMILACASAREARADAAGSAA